MTGDAELLALYERAKADVAAALAAVDRGEAEVAWAADRWPDAADALFHAFDLIQPGDGMGPEFVARGHARELLERVATGADTRPGTAAEVVLLCSQASQVAPFHAAAAGLYMRMWAQAFPDHPWTGEQADTLAHHEALDGSGMDDLERECRRKLAVPSRRLQDVECDGDHHGTPVDCRYAHPIPRPAPGFHDQHGTWIPQQRTGRRGRQEEVLF